MEEELDDLEEQDNSEKVSMDPSQFLKEFGDLPPANQKGSFGTEVFRNRLSQKKSGDADILSQKSGDSGDERNPKRSAQGDALSHNKNSKDNQRVSELTSSFKNLSEKQVGELKDQIEKVIMSNKGGLPHHLLEQFGEEIKRSGTDSSLIEHFYDFCKEKLPSDQKYKESVLFVSLFYYFLEKRQMIKGD